ncbi:MAG TPA: hypothetical protein VGF69_22535 [Thermoanaerobaculia bacterium]|jgi:hypothetical protein
MARVEEVEEAVLQAIRASEEPLPKTIIDELQRRADFTDALVAEAIWRLVANHKVQLTKTLRLRTDGQAAAAAM